MFELPHHLPYLPPVYSQVEDHRYWPTGDRREWQEWTNLDRILWAGEISSQGTVLSSSFAWGTFFPEDFLITPYLGFNQLGLAAGWVSTLWFIEGELFVNQAEMFIHLPRHKQWKWGISSMVTFQLGKWIRGQFLNCSLTVRSHWMLSSTLSWRPGGTFHEWRGKRRSLNLDSTASQH